MRKVIAVALVITAGLAAVAPARAQGHPRDASRESLSSVTWAQRDTAVYVVSTLNLLRTQQGQPMSRIFKSHFGVRYYDVYSDSRNRNLYFIELRGQGGNDIANLAYEMGWQKPKSLGVSLAGVRLTLASESIVASFHNDRKIKIGSFTSTLPA